MPVCILETLASTRAAIRRKLALSVCFRMAFSA
jgi:hypothetical protein